jgi:hypothetical protein
MPTVSELTDQRVIVAVPADAVTELQRERLAKPLPRFRGPALDAMVTVGTDAATLVTLLQAPDAIKSFADWVRRRSARSGTSIELTAKRGGRRISLMVDGDVDIQAVSDFLVKAFADGT